MKGTEVSNTRRSSACDWTCVLTRIDHCVMMTFARVYMALLSISIRSWVSVLESVLTARHWGLILTLAGYLTSCNIPMQHDIALWSLHYSIFRATIHHRYYFYTRHRKVTKFWLSNNSSIKGHYMWHCGHYIMANYTIFRATIHHCYYFYTHDTAQWLT